MICADVTGATNVDLTMVRKLLAQSDAAATLSIGDPAAIYAAALIQQTLSYPPVQRRAPMVGWASALLALARNGVPMRQGFDPSTGLAGLQAAHRTGRLVLASALDLIDDLLA